MALQGKREKKDKLEFKDLLGLKDLLDQMGQKVQLDHPVFQGLLVHQDFPV